MGYRTVDVTLNTAVGDVTFYGGGKFGMYSYWPCGATTPDNTQPVQYEFYNYTAGNFGEVGNSALVSATRLDVLPGQYLASYGQVSHRRTLSATSQFQTVAQTAKKTLTSATLSPRIGC